MRMFGPELGGCRGQNVGRVAAYGFFPDLTVAGTLPVRDALEALAMHDAYYHVATYDPNPESRQLWHQSHEEWLSTGRGNAHGFGVAALM